MFHAYDHLRSVVIDRVEQFVHRKYWQIELAAAVWLYTGFVAFPSFDIFRTEFAPAWAPMYQHAEHMLEPLQYGPESHESKMTFRLFFPVLVNLFHIGPVAVLALKFLAGFFTAWLFIKACYQLVSDSVLTVLLTLALACTHMPRCTFDISGKLDTFAFLFLLLPLAFRNPLVIFTGVFLAAWVDERGLIASALVFLFFLMRRDKRRGYGMAAVVLAWIAYLALRFYLAQRFHLVTPIAGTGLSVLKAQLSSVWLASWSALEGLWLIVIAAFVYWIRERQYVTPLLTAAALGLVLVVGLMVLDVSRSVAYAFPVLFLVLPAAQQAGSADELRRIAFLALVLSFAFPAYVIGDLNRVVWQLPMPLQLLRMFFL